MGDLVLAVVRTRDYGWVEVRCLKSLRLAKRMLRLVEKDLRGER